MAPPGRPAFPETPRGASARIVYQWLRSSVFPERLLESVGRDRGFVTEVVLGTVRWHRLLAFYRDRLVARKPRMAADAFLLTGLYQVFFLDDAEPYATVNETVADAGRTLGCDVGNFVNGVLRSALRERVALATQAAAQPEGVRFSHPDELVARWERMLGRDGMLRLCAWNNTRPETMIRVVRAKCGMAEFLATLAAAGIDARPHARRPEACAVLPRGVRIEDVPGYKAGSFAVQDPSTLLAVDLLDPRPGEAVLDACAAPGGKAAAIAERMGGCGTLFAADVADSRLPRLRENLARLGHVSVRVLRADASAPDLLREDLARAGADAFDAVLADVPCSNTGVLRRRPDARWRFSAGRLTEVNRLQAGILGAAACVVRAGGRMVYSTCSLEPEENERLVGSWLADRPDFALRGEMRSVPPDSGMDGAYAALLVRS
jgi:16S rRNA (cytosine967-C5)-methyltransferase